MTLIRTSSHILPRKVHPYEAASSRIQVNADGCVEQEETDE